MSNDMEISKYINSISEWWKVLQTLEDYFVIWGNTFKVILVEKDTQLKTSGELTASALQIHFDSQLCKYSFCCYLYVYINKDI